MTPLWWSILLSTIGATGVYLTGRRLWIGFAIGLGAQVLWVAYGVSTEQWGFLGSAALYGWMNFVSLRRWLADREGDDSAPTGTSQTAAGDESRPDRHDLARDTGEG